MIDKIKQLREQTGISIAECKKALEKTNGDMEKAMEALRERSRELVDKKAGAETKEGIIESYIHSNSKIGALVELNCQTDFVALNQDFRALAKDLAMQIAATEVENIDDLLAHPFIKDPSKTIQDLINESIAKLGENIKISKFVRFAI
ncbi:MAG: Elongation factor Ts [Parcubacteria group bacterium GW2011_GWF2_39_13b]|nr:MAG: Elongation factor Ts [Parcubacteria group bacterium GW2011_GWF2_39_13b]